MEPLSIKEILIIEHLIDNKDVLQAQLAPQVEIWKGDKQLYAGNEKLFNDAFKKWYVDQIMLDVMGLFQVTYEDAAQIVTYKRLKEIWSLTDEV